MPNHPTTTTTVLILEDEAHAADRLEKRIRNYDPRYRVVAKLPSLKLATDWLLSHSAPELIFMDTQLEDGPGWMLFGKISPNSLVVLTLVLDEAIPGACRERMADLLYKPVHPDELALVLNRLVKRCGKKSD